MSKRVRRLGRGIEALLGAAGDDVLDGDDASTIFDEASEGDVPGTVPMTTSSSSLVNTLRAENPVRAEARRVVDGTDEHTGPMQTIAINLIDRNPYQPRRDFGETELASLTESLKRHEMLQPVLVRRMGDRFELISGERRLRAAQRAGWTAVPASIREADDRLVAELAIVENVQRKDLDPLEKAASFRRYIDEHGCTQEELAKRIALDRATIANLMRLLELPDVVQDHVRRGRNHRRPCAVATPSVRRAGPSRLVPPDHGGKSLRPRGRTSRRRSR